MKLERRLFARPAPVAVFCSTTRGMAGGLFTFPPEQERCCFLPAARVCAHTDRLAYISRSYRTVNL